MKKYFLIIVVTIAVFLTGCESKASNNEAWTYDKEASTKEVQKPETNEAASPDTSAQLQKDEDDVFVIREKMFITQINDIYLNPDEYKDKTIRLEGIFDAYEDPEDSKYNKYYVIRYGPGCCGNDGVAGFQILFNGDKPKPNDWIEVTGELQMVVEDGSEYVALKVNDLKVLTERGAEYVDN